MSTSGQPADGMRRMVVVGAGPAGIRAAQTLVHHGVRPVLIDEAPAPGGQIYRQAPPGRARSPRSQYGFEWRKAAAIHRAGAELARQSDYRPGTTVWNAAPGLLDVQDGQGIGVQPYERLLLATGATDRVLPFPGWTLPGVFTLGGAQVALKAQQCVLGPRIVFAGTGPLLYLVAYQYARAGAQVAAVLDSSPGAGSVRTALLMARQPALLVKGAYYVAWLRAHRVPLYTCATLQEAQGNGRVDGVTARWRGRSLSLACDALATGYGLRSETQLADLLGCEFAFDADFRAWLPRMDADGRSSVPQIYLAGDGAGIGGADLAELAGELAALAMLRDQGVRVDESRMAGLRQRVARARGFRRALEGRFPLPAALARECPDDVPICRCEEILVGEARQVACQQQTRDPNRLKALARVGMGMCQGRMCQTGAAEILADCAGVDIGQVGRLRAQAPVKPLVLREFSERRP